MPEFLNLNKRIQKLEQEDLEKQKSEEKMDIYERLESFLTAQTEPIEPTAMPAIKLYMYNFMAKHPEAKEVELKKAFSKVNRLSELESKYGHESNILPTIGIEIETPKVNLTYDRIRILKRLDIPNYEESADYLWEVNPDFSYSPQVQARIIQELARMGALPLEEEPLSSRKKIPKSEFLSLHVNFGMPRDLNYEKVRDHKVKIREVNDILTYAFSSTDRLKNRKTSTSLKIQTGVQKSKKNSLEKPEGRDRDYHDPIRLELRAGEFRDYPTYRMLSEAQKLVALLIAHIQEEENIAILSPRADDLLNLWEKFEKEVQDLRENFNLSQNMIDSYKLDDIVKILEETDLREKCRKIITKYSKEVAKILKLEEEALDS